MPIAPPIVVAHRGASGYRPEHTSAAYRLAIALGADAVEPDLVASSDGVLVIRHENEISTTTDVAQHPEFASRRTTKRVDGVRTTGWFTEDFTWAELATLRTRERLPRLRPGNTAFDGRSGMLRLEDLLAILDQAPGVGLAAELKHSTYFASLGIELDALLADTLAAAGWDDDAHVDRVTLKSFELSVLTSARARGVRGRFIYLFEAEGAPADRPNQSYASSLTDDGLSALAGVVDGISVDKQILLATDDAGTVGTTDLVARAHALGLLVYCWTLRAENAFLHPHYRGRGAKRDLGAWAAEFALVMASGVNGVFADQPDLAIEARERFVQSA